MFKQSQGLSNPEPQFYNEEDNDEDMVLRADLPDIKCSFNLPPLRISDESAKPPLPKVPQLQIDIPPDEENGPVSTNRSNTCMNKQSIVLQPPKEERKNTCKASAKKVFDFKPENGVSASSDLAFQS